MDRDKVLSLIDKKIQEHKYEVDMSNNLMDKYRTDMSTVDVKLTNKNEDLIKDTLKLGVLKDKIIFHKACIAALEDLKQNIE
jgi:hypothetical protein